MSDVAKAIAESAASVAQKQSEAAAHAKDQGMGMDLVTGKPITPGTVRGNVINPYAVAPGNPDPNRGLAAEQPGTTNRSINSKDTR